MAGEGRHQKGDGRQETGARRREKEEGRQETGEGRREKVDGRETSRKPDISKCFKILKIVYTFKKYIDLKFLIYKNDVV